MIVFSKGPDGTYAYGHAAAVTFSHACEKALIEMCRHQMAVSLWRKGRALTGCEIDRDDLGLFERRALHFSTPAGFSEFWERAESSKAFSSVAPEPAILFDGEIFGPWSRYATVWRVLLKHGTGRFLEDNYRYFFW